MDFYTTTDYREILASALAERCERNSRYSQRAFARDLSIAPHRLSQILRGKQGLSRARAANLAQRMGLRDDEVRDFCDLVDAKHARSASQKQAAARRADQRRVSRKEPSADQGGVPVQDLSLAQFHLIADWYHLAILELAKLPQFSPEPRWIARCLGIQEAEVSIALDRLVQLGLATRNGDGLTFSSDDHAVGKGVPSEAIRIFHRRLIEKSLSALASQAVEDRAFNTSVLAIPRAKIDVLKQRIGAFWQELFVEFGAGNAPPDDVFCIGIQAFHLTDRAVLDEGKRSHRENKKRATTVH